MKRAVTCELPLNGAYRPRALPKLAPRPQPKRLGGRRQQARNDEAAQELTLDGLGLEDAGGFAVVLEAIPDTVAEAVTSRLTIPAIGVGAGPSCDGQVLVGYDILGLFDGSCRRL
jgi:ketopantoate hydroxymethyltransferase